MENTTARAYLNEIRAQRDKKYKDLKEIRRLWVHLMCERAKIKAYNAGDLIKVHFIDNACEYAWELMEKELIERY